MVNKQPSRRRLTPEARRAELVARAVELIGTETWEELSVADIAGLCGVSKPLLYHYFSTKRDLYLAALGSAAEDLHRAIVPDRTASHARQLVHSLSGYVDHVSAHEASYRAFLQGTFSHDPEVRRIVEASRMAVVDRVSRDLGLARPTPTLRVALLGWVGFLESSCLTWVATPGVSRERFLRLLVASLPALLTATSATR